MESITLDKETLLNTIDSINKKQVQRMCNKLQRMIHDKCDFSCPDILYEVRTILHQQIGMINDMLTELDDIQIRGLFYGIQVIEDK